MPGKIPIENIAVTGSGFSIAKKSHATLPQKPIQMVSDIRLLQDQSYFCTLCLAPVLLLHITDRSAGKERRAAPDRNRSGWDRSSTCSFRDAGGPSDPC